MWRYVVSFIALIVGAYVVLNLLGMFLATVPENTSSWATPICGGGVFILGGLVLWYLRKA